MRDSIEALNGIGHAAVITDPGFRAALAAHGYTLDPESGEVEQLAGYAGAFSARAAQIGRNIDRYQAQWRTGNPGAEPGPGLRRSWDARAWAEARPDKVVPTDGAALAARWAEELTSLGFVPPQPAPARNVRAQRSPQRSPHDDDVPDQGHVLPETIPGAYPGMSLGAASGGARVGALDRDQAVAQVLARLGARRSGWNAADIRGEVEQLIARAGLVVPAGVRIELAEDLTARTLKACVLLLGDHDRAADGPAVVRSVPEHVRALTSSAVLAVEDDLTTRLSTRAQAGLRLNAAQPVVLDSVLDPVLDAGQRAVAGALSGSAALVVVEGAAGTGKTTTLAAAHTALRERGRRLVVL
ncbi:MAG: relaxase domain-containing protein, partial [Streptosporangiaceae bacterium]